MTDIIETNRCSFCAKPEDEALVLIAGPSALFICDECVDSCAETVESHRAPSGDTVVETIARAMPRDVGYPQREACAHAALAALTEAGYAIVPVEPTPEMLRASLDCDPPLMDFGADGYDPFMTAVWQAMIETWRVKA
jgi:hypothetical protein